jgi:nucleotide-binding universal stress UspA family protein
MAIIRTVLAAIDLSDLSPIVMDYASSLARAWHAHLLVGHVVPDLSYFPGVYVSDTPLPELQLRLESEAQEHLATLCQSVLGAQVAHEALVVTGRPATELHRLLQEHRVDCLVLGAHSIDKPEHQLFGSTMERLTQQSPCPIWVVPPRKSSDFVSHG